MAQEHVDTGTLGTAEATIVAVWEHFAPLDLERLFIQHYPALRAAAQALPEQGVLVAGVDPRMRLAPTCVLDPTLRRDGLAHLVVGRHPQAQLCLPLDQSVALRHLLLHLVRGEGSRVAVEVRDLCTGQGFTVAGHGQLCGARTEGPLVLRVGGNVVFVLPKATWPEGWPTQAAEAWRTLPRSELHEPEAMRPAPGGARMVMPARRATGEHEVSRVFSLPQLSRLARALKSPKAGPLVGVLTVYAGGGAEVHSLTREELERGVLLGRYERCLVGQELGDIISWSRVHALLVREGDRLFIYDTASTAGTVIDALEVDRAVLGERAVISMGPDVQAVWERASVD
jgi:hypothetical protein